MELWANVGATVAFQLENSDRERHYFDIDELYVHVALPAGTLSLALFRPSAPGIHTFHCHVLGH